MDTEDSDEELIRRLARAQGADAGGLATLVEQAGARFPRKHKAIRAHAIGQAFARAAEIAQALDWRGAVVLQGGRVIVETGGVRFYADQDGRFFKGGGGFPAKRLLRTLDERGVRLGTVFDVGANIGEVAIYLACRRPQARVVAFEPAPENLQAFEQNLALQRPHPANLELIAEAVSDRAGEIELLVGAAAMNTVMVEAGLERLAARGRLERRMTRTDTLEGYCRRLTIERIDFLKIDIEGAEPLLAESVARLKGRIGAAYVEISPFNTAEAYLRLVEAFAAGGLAMHDSELQVVAEPSAWIERSQAAGQAPNVWFLPP
jgi:FkbM family methyltransferase